MAHLEPRATGVVAAIGLALAALVAGPPLEASAEGDTAGPRSCSSQLTGVYRYVGGSADEHERIAAIKKGTAGMMFIARAIARRRLESGTKPYQEIGIRVGDHTITIQTDVKWVTPTDGKPRSLRDAHGEQFSVSTHVDHGHLVQKVGDESLRNTNTFSLVDGGCGMRMHVRIDHDRLSGVIDYTLSYRRERQSP